MQKAMQDFDARSLLVKPKPIKQYLKISKKKLGKQLGKKINTYNFILFESTYSRLPSIKSIVSLEVK
jgi:hypothetical protein